MNDARHRPWVALALAGAITATALVTGVFAHELATRVAGDASFGWPALVAGRWWTLATSLVLTRNWFMAATMPIAVFGALGAYERVAGHARATTVAIIGHVTGSVVVALGAGIAGTTGDAPLVRAAQNLDYGASMVVAGALGALASRLDRRRFTQVCFAGVVLLVPLHHQMADWAHLVAMPAGFAIDRARRPTARVIGLTAVSAATAWLTLAGAGAVTTAAETVRFRDLPAVAHPPATASHAAALAAPDRFVTLPYLAHDLGNRPEVADVLVPVGISAAAPARVIVFFHGVPGAPQDWLAGGRLRAVLGADPNLAHTIAVLVDTPGFHDPRAGWHNVHGQLTIESIRDDVLPAVARRWPVATGPHSIAVVGAGRGASGAVGLARTDRRVGWLVAFDPARPVPHIPGVAVDVHMSARGTSPLGATRWRLLDASERWERWQRALPAAFVWLDQHGFTSHRA